VNIDIDVLKYIKIIFNILTLEYFKAQCSDNLKNIAEDME